MPVIAQKKTREADRREVTYTPPSEFDLPEEIREKFEAEGYHLGWIRIMLEDKDDYKNIAKRRREGFEFVTVKELPEHLQGMYEVKNLGNAAQKYSGIVVTGDLALGKLPMEKHLARQKYYAQMAINNEMAQRSKLDSDSKMNRLLPLIDESRSVVRVGGRKNSPNVGFGESLKSTSKEDTDEE